MQELDEEQVRKALLAAENARGKYPLSLREGALSARSQPPTQYSADLLRSVLAATERDPDELERIGAQAKADARRLLDE